MGEKYWTSPLIFAIACFFMLPAQAATPMATGAPVVPPAGFIGFCAHYLQECVGSSPAPAPLALTPERRRQLEAVQAEINRAIRPREDPAHVWDYPVDGTGDCNRYALAKRRALIELGWPRAALLLAVAFTETGEGHLVLVARTSEGDLVLDNRAAEVVDWRRLPYRWISRQSPQRPTEWVRILDRPVTLAESRAGG